MATRCSILEGSLTLLVIFRTVSAVPLSVWRMWTLPAAENVLVALERNCSDENFELIRSLICLNLFEKSQCKGNKPVTWKDFLMSWVLIRWNPKTPHISWNGTAFVLAIAMPVTSSLISLTAPLNALLTNWSHGWRKCEVFSGAWTTSQFVLST